MECLLDRAVSHVTEAVPCVAVVAAAGFWSNDGG